MHRLLFSLPCASGSEVEMGILALSQFNKFLIFSNEFQVRCACYRAIIIANFNHETMFLCQLLLYILSKQLAFFNLSISGLC